MSTFSSRIWVLLTDGVNSRICSCEDGTAMPITSPAFDFAPDSDDGDLMAHTAWFKADRQSRLSRSVNRQHILHVGQLLSEAARERAYDGLIIIAAEPIATELEDALAPESRALLIGKLVRDFAAIESSMTRQPAIMRH